MLATARAGRVRDRPRRLDSRTESRSFDERGAIRNIMRQRMSLTALAVAVVAVAAQIPTFDDFHVDPVFVGRPAAPALSNPFQRRFRTQIVRQSKFSPNFAGHYGMADWGCGTSCVTVVIIDLESGTVYDGPFKLLDYAVRRR
jgi:hypothetical protein